MTGQNDRQDESLTGQVHDQAGHCPLTGRYFEPYEIAISVIWQSAICILHSVCILPLVRSPQSSFYTDHFLIMLYFIF